MFLRWGTLSATLSGSITLTPGIDPDSFNLTVAFDAENPPAVDAELTFGDGDGGEIRIPDCRIVDGTIRHDTDAKTVSFTVQDWRWRWAQSEPISGEFNRRDEQGFIIGRKKNAVDLAIELYANLETPAEKKVEDLGALPEDLFPSVNWDFANAAEELFFLAQRYGMVFAPYIDDDHPDGPAFWGARMWRQGEGFVRPGFDRKWFEVPINVTRKPQEVIFVGGKNWIQTEVELEPVGFHPVLKRFVDLSETDPTLKLPYRPDTGFFPGFEEGDLIPGGPTNAEYDDAVKSVYFYYRLKGISFTLPDGTEAFGWFLNGTFVTIEELKRRMRDNLTAIFTVDKERLFSTAYVRGAWATAAGEYDPKFEEDDPDSIVPVKFEIDRRTGLVKFEEPVFGLGSDLAGEFSLGAVFEGKTYVKRLPTVGAGSVEGLVDTVRVSSVFELIVNSTRQNEDEAFEAAEAYVAAHLRRYAIAEDAQVSCFPGIVPLNPDGMVMQVSWNLDAGGPRTVASWGYEFDPSIIPAIVREKELDNNFAIRERRSERLATSISGDKDFGPPLNDGDPEPL